MWKSIMLMGVVVILAMGCSVEPLLNPPVGDVKELDGTTNKTLIGKWKANSNDTIYEGEVTWAADENGKVMDYLQIVATASHDSKIKPMLPMLGGAFIIDNEIYMVLCADVNKLVAQAKYAEASVWMLRTNFFVAKLTRDDADFKLEWINFFEKTKNEAGKDIEIPIDSLARKENNLVINNTQELRKLLKEKKYKLQSPIILQKLKS